MKRLLMLLLALIVVFSFGASCKRYKIDDVENVAIQITDTGPIEVNMKLRDAVANLVTKTSPLTYRNDTDLITGDFEYYQFASSSDFYQEIDMQGSLKTKTSASKNYTLIKVTGEGIVKKRLTLKGLEQAGLVNLMLKVSAEEGWIIIKDGKPVFPDGIPLKVLLMRRLGIREWKAIQMIDEYGKITVENAIEETETLSDFFLWLKGPRCSLEIKDNTASLQCYHPDSGKLLKHLHPSVSIVDDSKRLLMLKGMRFDSEEKAYTCYLKNKKSWTTSFKELPADSYLMHVDIKTISNMTVPIWITDKRNIVNQFNNPSGFVSQIDLKGTPKSLNMIKVQFTNNGNTLISPKGEIRVMSESGQVIRRIKLGKFNISPGEQKSNKIPIGSIFKDKLKSGIYRLIAMFDYADGKHTVGKYDFQIKN